MATYTSPPDLAELERDAWRRGDYATADLAGQLMDAEGSLAELADEGFDDAADAIQRCQDAEQKLANVHDAIAALDRIMDAIKRLPRRADIMAAVNAIAMAAGGP